MIDGVYHCDHDWHGNHTINVTIKARETDKFYILELVSDNSRFPNGNITEMFRENGRVRIPKRGGKHAVVEGRSFFVIYPFRNGVPFCFDLVDPAPI